ncbi:DUF29 domain-containing protein [Crocosphaera sp. UHCC 0190]|uniref:DUF29 domain-containing protein n=1 Tax=Crocosphaera sp. UHCC 0190 TaxID=3110246 RepID=UPI002B212F5D|nr:DUF29 domain-containing protein [Crocosphaera sp. UHCC 0190]MEA5509171.1 DUF29 domain-containing protein [Crocosphaera sp. UHCC 0190]
MSKYLYEKDFNLWLAATIKQLETYDFEALDTINLIEELKDLGKAEKNALESNLMILLAHLLKLTVQADVPETMKNSWYNSVIEHRKRIKKQLSKTPSLKSYLPKILEEAYNDGRDIAIQEGKKASFGIPIPDESEYPTQCIFTIEQILDDDFFS